MSIEKVNIKFEKGLALLVGDKKTMKINKNEVINLIDNSFTNNNTNSLIRWCKSIIMCAGISKLDIDDYIARLSVLSLLLDIVEPIDGIVCSCQAKKILNIESYNKTMFSESMSSEKQLKIILLEINKDNYDNIEII